MATRFADMRTDYTGWPRVLQSITTAASFSRPAWIDSIFCRAACKRRNITGAMRLKSSYPNEGSRSQYSRKIVPVEKNRVGRLCCARGKVPDIRREHPRPAQQIAGADRFNDQRVAGFFTRLEHYFPALDQIKTIGQLAFEQNGLSFFRMDGDCAITQ